MAEKSTQCRSTADLQNTHVIIEKEALDSLYREVKQLKRTLPKLLNKELLDVPIKLQKLQQECHSISQEKKLLEHQFEMLKKRYDTTINEVERQKKDNGHLRLEISELTDITNEQSDYCMKLGSTTCALLWKASQQDACMHDVLNSEHSKQFICLASHTLHSYYSALQENVIRDINTDNEDRFVTALAGVITNISASAYGRELIMTCEHGKDLLTVVISIVSDLPVNNRKLMKLKNLALTTLYNVSIDQKGMKFLCLEKELFKNLSFVIESDKCCDNRLLALRLIQSIIVEPDCIEVVHVILELLPVEKLEGFAVNCQGELLDVFQELIKDLRLLACEQ